MLTAPLESPLTRVEEDLKGEALQLFIMVHSILSWTRHFTDYTFSHIHTGVDLLEKQCFSDQQQKGGNRNHFKNHTCLSPFSSSMTDQLVKSLLKTWSLTVWGQSGRTIEETHCLFFTFKSMLKST